MKCHQTQLGTLIFIAALLLGGCQNSYTLKPESLQQNGLVVGEVTLIDGVPVRHGRLYRADLSIDGRLYPSVVDDGHFAVDLPPGTHTLQSLRYQVGNWVRTYPMKRTFSLSAGAATNIGNIVLLLDAHNPQRYSTFFVDNNEHMTGYLRHSIPKVHAELRNKQPFLAAGQFANALTLKQLRQQVATRQFSTIRASGDDLVSGELGTIARIYPSKAGTVVDVVDSGTSEPLWACDKRSHQAACLFPDAGGNTTLLKVDLAKRKKPIAVPGPKGFVPFALYHYGMHGYIALDRHSDIYFSSDDGRSWSHYDEARNADEYMNDTRFGPSAYYGKSGLYLLTQQDHGMLLHLTTDTAPIEKIESPAPEYFMSAVIETPAALILGPQQAMIGNSLLFIRPKGSSQWTSSEIPGNECMPLTVRDKAGMLLEANCEKGSEQFISTDGGKSWAQKGKD